MKSIFLFLILALPITIWADTVTMQVSQYDDENIATVLGSTDISDEFNMNAEIDSTGYLGLGGGYGVILEQWYVEGFANYGRADNIDIYDLGGLLATRLTQSFTIHFISYHQWRKTKGFPIIELELFDQREWKNTLGFSYTPISWFEVSCSVSFDRLLSSNRQAGEVENKNISSQDLTLTFKPQWVEPFVRYTTGEHRVRPGEPITRDDTLEAGISMSF